jgi:hypothetical protein
MNLFSMTLNRDERENLCSLITSDTDAYTLMTSPSGMHLWDALWPPGVIFSGNVLREETHSSNWNFIPHLEIVPADCEHLLITRLVQLHELPIYGFFWFWKCLNNLCFVEVQHCHTYPLQMSLFFQWLPQNLDEDCRQARDRNGIQRKSL